jgi:hypothetical protein
MLARGRVVATKKLEVGRRGRLSARLAFAHSRVLVFRARGAGGNVVRVRLPIRVVRRAAAATATAAAAGGLSITPAILEGTAGSGVTGTVTLANNTSRSLKIDVTPRPWRQSRSGAVAADRRHTLDRFVRVSDAAFTLAAGARRAITVTLARVPARGSLYGSLEVIGRPAKKKGVNVAYRLIGSLRFNPSKAARKLRLSAGTTRVRGRTLSLVVSNRGNTIDPVGGRVVVSGPRGGRSGGISAVKILPGKRVNVVLMSLRGLRAGRYTAAVTLRQRGRNRVSVSRHFHIRGS